MTKMLPTYASKDTTDNQVLIYTFNDLIHHVANHSLTNGLHVFLLRTSTTLDADLDRIEADITYLTPNEQVEYWHNHATRIINEARSAAKDWGVDAVLDKKLNMVLSCTEPGTAFAALSRHIGFGTIGFSYVSGAPNSRSIKYHLPVDFYKV